MRNLPIAPRAMANGCRLLCGHAVALLLVVLMCSGASSAYSVLTHEEIVVLVWADQIRPLLLQRYPGLSEDQIKEAHAYAYRGAVIQDLGYYPFGSGISATWCITFAAGTLSASCCSKTRMSTST